MVTNAERPAWRGDVAIPGSVARGLAIASKVRAAKLAVVEERDAVLIGRLDPATWRIVRDTVMAALPGADDGKVPLR